MGTPTNSGGIEVGCCFQQKTCNISEMGQDRTKVRVRVRVRVSGRV